MTEEPEQMEKFLGCSWCHVDEAPLRGLLLEPHLRLAHLLRLVDAAEKTIPTFGWLLCLSESLRTACWGLE